MLHYLASRIPMAPGDPTPAPSGAPRVGQGGVNFTELMPNWSGQDFLIGVFLIAALLIGSFIGLKVMAGAGQGKPDVAGKQGAHYGIGLSILVASMVVPLIAGVLYWFVSNAVGTAA